MAKWTFGKKQKARSRHAPIENNPARSTLYQPQPPQPLTEKSDNLGLNASRYADPAPAQKVTARDEPQGVVGEDGKKHKAENVEAHEAGKESPGGVRPDSGPAKLQRRKREVRDQVPSYYYQPNSGSRESLQQRHTLAEPPTLRPKTSEPEAMARRQSSKRRKRDPNREEEIKHMSSAVPPVPKRPVTVQWWHPRARQS